MLINPYAFPHESYDAEADMDTVKPGMTLRDWFAGQVMAGIDAFNTMPDATTAASWAYHVADAMLAERSKAVGDHHA